MLLHGYGESLLAWRSVFDCLSEHADVIALDLPGSGLSAKPPDVYSRESMASLVIGTLDALGVDRAFLVGHSLGGAVAVAAAARSPQRFLGLVLIAPALARPLALGRRPEAARPGERWREAVVARYVLLRGRFGGVHDPWWLAEDSASASYDPLRDPRYAQALRAVVREFDFDLLTPALAGSIREPVQVTWGSVDPLVPPSTADRLLDLLPSARLVVIPRSWHRPHVERPEVVTRLTLDFLLRAEQRSPAVRH